jgi:hypothetical protein
MISDYPLWILTRDSTRFRSFTFNHTSFTEWMEYIEILLSGELFRDKWKPPKLFLYYDEEIKGGGEESPVGDFMNGIGKFSINVKALSILKPIIRNQVELLPLETSIGPYFELNIKQIACLDISKCDVVRFKSSERIKQINKYAFNDETIRGRNIFCSSELRGNTIFVSELFKNTVELNNLTGVEFEKVQM